MSGPEETPHVDAEEGIGEDRDGIATDELSFDVTAGRRSGADRSARAAASGGDTRLE